MCKIVYSFEKVFFNTYAHSLYTLSYFLGCYMPASPKASQWHKQMPLHISWNLLHILIIKGTIFALGAVAINIRS